MSFLLLREQILGFRDEYFLQNGPYVLASNLPWASLEESVLSLDLRGGEGVGEEQTQTLTLEITEGVRAAPRLCRAGVAEMICGARCCCIG